MTIVNLTPHAVRLLNDDGSLLREIAPSGSIVRVAMEESLDDDIVVDGADIPVVRLTPGDVEGLPAEGAAPGARYIVPGIVASALGAQRSDLLTPYPLVRDGAGRVIGCGGFSRP